MEKLKMHSMNNVEANVAKIATMFPNCLTERITDEGAVEKVIDFDILKQELSFAVVEGSDERYQFTWPDKKKAILAANAPINKTLRPCRGESVDFENTENLYIEGDNLEVLKLLQETYLGKFKVIYIDPPYNTGNDFVYNDAFAEDAEIYLTNSGQFDADGNRLVQNTESNGRYHTDWLNMIYPRLKIAKNLLSDDGVIFISIDDNEINNLRKICDEVFGSDNFICQFVVAANAEKNNAKLVSVSHEYMLCYAKSSSASNSTWRVKKNYVDEYMKRVNQLLSMGMSYEEIHKELMLITKYPRFFDFDHYTLVDEKGVYRTSDAGGVAKGNFDTEIIHPVTGKPCAKPRGGWRYKDAEIKRMVAAGEFDFGEDETTIPVPKRYLKDFMYQIPKSILFFDAQATTKWLKKEGLPFDFPKPVELLKYVISIFPQDALVLDFFSGSGTTAHAVMQLNAEDGGNRKFVMVQLPEETDIKSDAYKAGFSTICEIGKERIRKAGNKIKSDSPLSNSCLDIGFRVLKCDTTNMKDVYYNPAEMEISLLSDLTDNIKEDRTPEDLLFQVMLDLGIMLSSKIQESVIAGKTVYSVGGNNLIACFDKEVTEETIKAIAMQKPYYFVMRDSSMANDSVATNFEQIFATYSPDTVRKVL